MCKNYYTANSVSCISALYSKIKLDLIPLNIPVNVYLVCFRIQIQILSFFLVIIHIHRLNLLLIGEAKQTPPVLLLH